MKDYGWKIKVADLLSNPWQKDNIKFEKKYLTDEFINLKDPGISWEVFLQWISQDEIILTVKSLSFSLIYECDKCWKIYSQSYILKPKETVKFVNIEKYPIEEKIYDTTFPIDMKNQTIDLTPLIEIIVKNQEPIIKNCWKHKTQEQTEEEIFQEEINQLTISFKDLLKF